MNGFMLDSARTLESRQYYLDALAFMQQRGCDTLLWHFTDDQGCSLRFDSLPGAASPNAYDKSELRELLDDARQRGITVIPELETLGHTRYLTHARQDLAELKENDQEYTSLCPVHPKAREVVGGLLDEVCELFDSELVHVGLDEVNFGGHPLTIEALRSRTPGELFAEYVNFLHRRLADHGRRMVMWGDQLLQDPSIAEQIPKDIVVANWQYTPEVPAETTRRLLDWGFEVISCPALITHDQTLYPGDSFAVPNLRSTAAHVREYGTLGTITTVWTAQRYVHGSLWPAMDLAAGYMTQGPGVETAARSAAFGREFYGLSEASAEVWAGAMVEVYRLSPMRKPWVAALKLEDDDRLEGVDVAEQRRAWGAVAGGLVELRGEVGSQAESYDALVLMSEVAAHVWDRLERWRDGEVTDQTLARSATLGEMLEEAWDRERFSDDPRKRRPMFPFDADNHLLVAFEAGTLALRRRLDPAVDAARGVVDGPGVGSARR